MIRAAEPVSVPPGDYGSDAAAYSWVATVRVTYRRSGARWAS